MSMSLNQIQELQTVVQGILERSARHAGQVNEVLLSLIGAMLWRKNPQDVIKVNTKEGAGGNVVWFRVDDTRYALLYSQEERVIKLVEGGRKGTVVETFTNATPAGEVARVFATLGKSVPGLTEMRKVRREDRDPNAPKDPQIKIARQLAKAQKAQKDPEAKAAKSAAKLAKADGADGADATMSKEARLQAKAAKALARDAKVKAQREKRRATRADEKATRLEAAEAAARQAAAEAATETAAEAAAAPAT